MQPQRDILEVDALFVGAGPASLAGAIRLAQLYQAHNEAVKGGHRPGPVLSTENILVIEKARNIGDHGISGAVVDPRGFRELLGEFPTQGCPIEGPVQHDELWFLTREGRLRAPIVPPPLKNHGKYIASLNKMVKWLASIAEKSGVQIFPEFPGQQLLFESERVVGVRTGDKGLDRDEQPKANYEPGPDLVAKVTVLGEGPRGTLVKQLEQKLNLSRGKNPQDYSIGIKEFWQMPKGMVSAGTVIYTHGLHLDRDAF